MLNRVNPGVHFLTTIIFSYPTAFTTTGGYFNPVLATALKFGCQGHTVTEHVVVYWGGSCVGSALSVFLYHHTKLRDIVASLAGISLPKEDEEDDYEKEE